MRHKIRSSWRGPSELLCGGNVISLHDQTMITSGLPSRADAKRGDHFLQAGSARNVALRLVRVSFRYADLQVELSRNEPSRRPARATPIDAAVY
jgi:hypothetical protein